MIISPWLLGFREKNRVGPMALCNGPMPGSSPRRGSQGPRYMATARQTHGRVAIACLARGRVAG
jgi:hypothetical protein